MVKIAICDDMDDQVNFIHQIVLDILKKNHELGDITLYTSSDFLRYDIQEGKYFDLILSDVEMPGVNGMELASVIRQYLPDSLVIFVTAYLKYAVDAFEYNIFRYIPKEKLREKLPDAIKDALKIIHLQINQFYTIALHNRFQKIALKNILYIQREGKNSIFFLTDNTIVKERKSLADVQKKLNCSDFAFVDRGCIVNLLHISSIQGHMIELENGTCISSSHTRLKEIKTLMQKLWRTEQ